MIFTMLFLPLLFSTGLAVDVVRTSMVRAQVAEAADAALLAAARRRSTDGSLTKMQAQRIARDYFDASDVSQQGVTIDKFKFDFTGTTYSIEVEGGVATTILGAVGKKALPVFVKAVAEVAPPRSLEAMLVLDVTKSMEGDRLSTLKQAATDLVNTLIPDNSSRPNIKMGIVPFAQYVNVGKSRRNESWIDVPADYSTTTNRCEDTYPDRRQVGTETRSVREDYNCRRVPSTCRRDGRDFPCQRNQCDTRWVDEEVPVYEDGDPVRVCTPRTQWFRFHGCVGSRDAPLNVEDRNYTGGNRVPGLMNQRCNEEVLPLTSVKGDIVDKIDSLRARNNTYIPAGLTWGLRMLSSGEPFSEGAPYASVQADGGQKALIVMTDGANTKSARFPKHNGNNAQNANTFTEDLCDEIKAAGIRVYSIAFEVDDNTIKNLLQACATEPSLYYDAKNANGLLDAFKDIGNSLTELSLTS
ncbi:MAG: pilus assembly protein TadG-related protein [Pseudomonadota bacterium]